MNGVGVGSNLMETGTWEDAFEHLLDIGKEITKVPWASLIRNLGNLGWRWNGKEEREGEKERN